MSEMLFQQYGLFVIGAGLSLVSLLLLFVVLRRNMHKKRGLRPAAAAVAAANAAATRQDSEANMTPDAMFGAADSAPHPAGDATALDAPVNEGGFKLFKRKTPKARGDSATQAGASRLVDVEQEMLAIRELFRAGQISRSVYVAETKALYETAQLVKD